MTPYELAVVETDQPLTLVELSGELDLTNERELEQRLGDLAAPGPMLVLDLNRVTFVDSAAIHMLFRLARSGGPEGPFAIVMEPTAPVARTLAIAGVDLVAAVRSSVVDLASAAAPSAS